MSQYLLNAVTEPNTPAAGKIALWSDSTDSNKPKAKLADGSVYGLSSNADANLLINGGFAFAQRQAPGTLTTYSNTTGRAYGADRWGMTNENVSIQYQRVDTSTTPETGLAARFYGKFKKITNAGKMVISQVIEGSDVMALRGGQVRLQFKGKFSVAAAMTIRAGILQLQNAGTIDTMPATFVSAFGAVGTDPTWGTNLAAINPDSTVTPENSTISGGGITSILGSNWTRYSAVFSIPSNCKNLVIVIWTNGQPAANDELNISEVGLYQGEEIVAWTRRPQQAELALCQRFYCKTFNVDTAPAQNTGAATGEYRTPSPVGASTAIGDAMEWEFPVQMRAAPATLTAFSPASASAQMRNQTLNTDCTATAVSANGEKRCKIIATTPASTVAGTNILGLHITADAEL